MSVVIRPWNQSHLMMLFLITSWLLVASTSAASDDACHTCLYNTCYSIHDFHPVNNSHMYPMAVDLSKNIVYIGYTDENGKFSPAAVYIDESNRVEDIPCKNCYKGGATVDQTTHDVYFFSSFIFGIHKYNPISKAFEAITFFNDKKIDSAQFKDNKLYYTILARPGLHVFDFKTGQSESVPALANKDVIHLAIDGKGDVYFNNNLQMDGTVTYYRLRNGSNDVETLVVNNGKYAFFVDPDDVMHFLTLYSSERKLYRLNSETDELVYVGTFKDDTRPVHLDFGNNGLYFGNYYLKREPSSNCVVDTQKVTFRPKLAENIDVTNDT